MITNQLLIPHRDITMWWRKSWSDKNSERRTRERNNCHHCSD